MWKTGNSILSYYLSGALNKVSTETCGVLQRWCEPYRSADEHISPVPTLSPPLISPCLIWWLAMSICCSVQRTFKSELVSWKKNLSDITTDDVSPHQWWPLIDRWGFWIRPSPVVISRDNYSDSSCFAFCHVVQLLWGWPGYCALLEAISLHWTLIVRNRLLSGLWKGDSAEPCLDRGTHSFHTQNKQENQPTVFSQHCMWLQNNLHTFVPVHLNMGICSVRLSAKNSRVCCSQDFRK